MPTDTLLSPLFRALADSVDEAVLVCGPDGVILHASPGQFPPDPACEPGRNVRDALKLPSTLSDLQSSASGLTGRLGNTACDIRIRRIDAPGTPGLFLIRARQLRPDLPWPAWLESLPAPVAVRDGNGRFLWANSLYIERFGARGDCIVGRHVDEVFCSTDARRTREADRYVLESGRNTLYEYICGDETCAAGHYLVLQSPMRLNGNATAVISVVEDKSRLRIELPGQEESEMHYQRLARHLLTYLDNHHASLARELHDVLGQTLIGTKLAIHNALIRPEITPDLAEAMRYWMVLLDESIQFVRNFAGSLHPRHTREFGLQRSMRAWLEQTRQLSASRPDFIIDIDTAMPEPRPETAHACLRIAQEAVSNALRHADADRLEVSLKASASLLTLRIADNGRGFCIHEPGEQSAGLGLISMSERAWLTGGHFDMVSVPGTGTTLTVSWPLTEN